MTTRIVSLLLLLCVAASPSGAQARDGEGVHATDLLERFTTGLESLHAQFAQQVIGNDGVVQDRSSGEVWLQRPRLFRWAYGGDFPELVVADGERVWIYDEALEQVTVKNQSETAADSPLTGKPWFWWSISRVLISRSFGPKASGR